jgi:hypothetical protein
MASTPFVSAGDFTHVEWVVEPRSPGLHLVSLQIRLPLEEKEHRFLFPKLTQFRCTLPGRLDLQVKDERGQSIYETDTDSPFLVEGQLWWHSESRWEEVTAKLDHDTGMRIVDGPSEPEQGDDLTRFTWRLMGVEPGHKHLEFRIDETGQSARANIWIKDSIDRQIQALYDNHVGPLDAEMVRYLRQLAPLFDSDEIRNIPYYILPLEEFAKTVHLHPQTERALRIMEAAREERYENIVLLNELLRYFAPMYSPAKGACVPFDPELTAKLVRLYPLDEYRLLFNFLGAVDSDNATYRHTIASSLLHEKYGHGFFYTHTTLGQQLKLLSQAGWLNSEVEAKLPEPYPLDVYQEYESEIRLLDHSAMTVNEGFAAWLELTFLNKMG